MSSRGLPESMQDCDARPRQTHLSSYAVHFPYSVEHARNDIRPSNGNASPKQDELTAYLVVFCADAILNLLIR